MCMRARWAKVAPCPAAVKSAALRGFERVRMQLAAVPLARVALDLVELLAATELSPHHSPSLGGGREVEKMLAERAEGVTPGRFVSYASLRASCELRPVYTLLNSLRDS